MEDVSTRDFLLNPLAFSLNSPLTTLLASLPSSDIHSPIGMQLVPSGLMIILPPFIKESPRFLLTKGKKDLALSNLAWVRKRSPDDPRVLEELPRSQPLTSTKWRTPLERAGRNAEKKE